ncbi:hypothetical protein BH20VER1_BH20VER1_19900 [soil metagenome]
MKNILFVLYHDFTANSAIHVHHFANELAGLGHRVAVAIPDQKETAANMSRRHYSIGTFPEFDGTWKKFFPDGKGPAVVHAWTPRENVRLFCEKLASVSSFTLIVHLEDNEERILEVNLGRSFADLERMADLQMPGNLSHPRNYRHFLAAADGVTMIMDRLQRYVPAATPKHILWPGADTSAFLPQPKDRALLASLGIPEEHLVLSYTGNVHSANAREVRSLYLAVALMNREGRPATLVRTGRDFAPFLGEDDTWARRHSVELGYLKQHHDLARILALADILIQPGMDDVFNEYRLPAKLPEFFSMGRPVLLPRTNVGRFVEHGRDAWVLPRVDALGIVDTVAHFAAEPALVERLSAGAVAFAREHFDWRKNARTLERFYDSLTPAPSPDHATSVASRH